MVRRNIIGNKVKSIRKFKNYTQKELVAKINLQGVKIDEPMLSRIESETRPILDYEVYAIANALNVSVDNLFNQND